MTEYTVDCGLMKDRTSVHDALQRSLPLPDYYGRNLDALYDCLQELGDCIILLKNADTLETLGDYGQALLETFRDSGVETVLN